MYSKVNTCVLQGLDGWNVEVETDLSRGIPVFNIVGLPDISIRESKERVRSAIKNSGFEFPLNRITINLAPANLKKEGSQIDLAIAVGILKSAGVIKDYDTDDLTFIGELSLDGKVNAIEGSLAMVISMRQLEKSTCILPYDNKEECGAIEGIDIIPVKNLKELVAFLNDEIHIKAYKKEIKDSSEEIVHNIDFSDIKGQSGLKRALEIAASGFHNCLIIGPPGAGKTMAARRIPTIMPNLTFEESIEVTKIYSISGLLPSNELIQTRQFRSPHHTASEISLIGGGRMPKPGEVSLSHNGVLFLDELPEFKKSVLEVLRQPLEDGFVTISRSKASLTFPSQFMLIASMNPCPCGYLGDPYHQCTCSQSNIDRYLGKISNPLLDRIDIHIEVSPVKYDDLKQSGKEENSSEIRKRVQRARDIQLDRFEHLDIYSNSQILPNDLNKYCGLDKNSESIMNQAFKKYNFTGRTYNKLLKVSRTIADLDGEKNIRENHLLEAIRYRTLDSKYWG